jgi:hypothetical protein
MADTKTGRTVAELAREACDVQNASNLSGVVLGFSRAIADLRALPEYTGGDWLCSHPVVTAWADKIASLCHIQDIGCDRAIDAHSRCEALARGEQ